MKDRRAFIANAASGISALGAMAAMTPHASAQLVYTTTDWKLSAFNEVAKTKARVKQVFDVTQISEGRFLNNIKNSLNGLHYGFGVQMDEIKIAAALHGPANMLNYDDFIWNKYKIGTWLKVDDSATGQPAVTNVFYPSKAGASQDPNSRESFYQDTSIQALQKRGVHFLSCHTATEEQARILIKRNQLSAEPEEIVKEMLAHTLPGVLVVASMVAAVALLQVEGKYSYIAV